MSKSIHIRLDGKLYRDLKILSDYYGITMSSYIKSKLIPSVGEEIPEKEFTAKEEDRLARSIKAGEISGFRMKTKAICVSSKFKRSY